MDNLFEILIVLFFIFSLLSPLLQKKKGPGTPPPQQRQPQRRSPSSGASLPGSINRSSGPFTTGPIVLEGDRREDYDFRPGYDSRPSYDQYTTAERDARERLSQKNTQRAESIKKSRIADFERDSSRRDSQRRESQRRETERKERERKEALQREALQKEIREQQERQALHQRQVEDIKSSLHNPQSLKRIFVISEILGKPKALRRYR